MIQDGFRQVRCRHPLEDDDFDGAGFDVGREGGSQFQLDFFLPRFGRTRDFGDVLALIPIATRRFTENFPRLSVACVTVLFRHILEAKVTKGWHWSKPEALDRELCDRRQFMEVRIHPTTAASASLAVSTGFSMRICFRRAGESCSLAAR